MRREFSIRRDWAYDLVKATKSAIAKTKCLGSWENISPAAVRAIKHIQENRCAVTSREFTVERMPYLVRADNILGWRLGNVILIEDTLKPLYRSCNYDMGVLYEVIQNCWHVPNIASLDIIKQVNGELEQEAFRDYAEDHV